MAQRFFSRTALYLWIGATIGAVCVLPFMNALLPYMHVPHVHHGPPPIILVVLGVVQSAVTLGLITFTGLWAARKLGMGAPLLDAWLGGEPPAFNTRRSALLAVILGLAAGAVLIALDLFVFVPFDPTGAGRLVHVQPPAWAGLLASFSGGMTEEVELRLFLLSFLALGLRYLRDWTCAARTAPLPPAVFWTANVIAAILFGLGHLPVTAALVPLTAPIIVRAIVLNGIVGLLAGYLFWRRGIEMAMLCHFSCDLLLHALPPLVGY